MKPVQNYVKNLGLLTLLADILAFNCNILLANLGHLDRIELGV